MESFDVLLAVLLILAIIFNAASPIIFRGKRVIVLQILQAIAIVFFLVKAIRTGNKFDFAFAGIFIAAVLIEYFRRKNRKQ